MFFMWLAGSLLVFAGFTAAFIALLVIEGNGAQQTATVVIGVLAALQGGVLFSGVRER